MRNIKLVLEYDGSKLFGFQRQPHHPTVQEELEKALSKLFNHKTKISAASGRTDSGVHAEHQVVNFKTASRIPAAQIQKALNGLLPSMIAVREAQDVPARFHARYSVRSKIYEYQIWNDPVRSPLYGVRMWHVPEKLDLKKIKSAADLLTGKKDFRSFCTASNGVPREKSTVRTIQKISVQRKGPVLQIQIQANGFLYRMARTIVGVLADAGRGKLTSREVELILKARDRRRAGTTAPSKGLSLVKVAYKKHSSAPFSIDSPL